MAKAKRTGRTHKARNLRAIVLAVLAAGVVGIILVLPGDLLFSAAGTDVTGQFIAWRAFAVDSILAGHLPFWNPHTYSGQPFLGGFQSALFYPPNFVFLILPVAKAINVSMALHLLWLGLGMAAWARYRGVQPIAAALCGVVLPMSGVVFPHLYAGHLSNLCTMAWAPWLLLGLDQWFMEKRSRGLLLATAAASMQILSGHVQYAFFSGVAVAIYAAASSIAPGPARRRALPAVAFVYAVAAALAAVQLLPGLSAAAEGLHQAKLDVRYAGVFSFPPENLLTLAAPGFFGGLTFDLGNQPYWGRCFLWEMTLFAGVCGLVCAAVAFGDRTHRRMTVLAICVVGMLFLLALGSHTPLFGLLHDWVPGFASFRGFSKFTFPAMLFLVLIIGFGADAIAGGRLPDRRTVRVLVGLGVCLMFAGLWLAFAPESAGVWMSWIHNSTESPLPGEAFRHPAVVKAAGSHAGWSLMMAGLILSTAVMCLWHARRRPALRWVPLAVLPIEMLIFAGGHFGSSTVDAAMPNVLRRFIADRPGDYRVMNLQFPNNGFLIGAPDAWGNDPAVLKRVAEFMTFVQGGDTTRATQDLPFVGLRPLHAILRLRFAFLTTERGVQVLENPAPPLPRALLVSDYRVIPDRDSLLAEMNRAGFDPRRIVLLESAPDPPPTPSSQPGTVRVIGETPNSLDLEADAATPALLLITDAYSRDWHARSISAGPQERYEVLPADHVVRAIPLAAGHHRLRLVYTPSYFMTGAGISIAAWLVFAGAWLVTSRRRDSPAQLRR